MNEIIKNWAIELKIALFMAVLIALSFLGGLINPIRVYHFNFFNSNICYRNNNICYSTFLR